MKKELQSVKVGDLVVHLQLRQSDDEQFLIIGAQCGETQNESSLTMHPSGSHTADSLRRDISELAKNLCQETAARESARLLREYLFK